MSDPDDLMARGRAIFERLRTAEFERRDSEPEVSEETRSEEAADEAGPAAPDSWRVPEHVLGDAGVEDATASEDGDAWTSAADESEPDPRDEGPLWLHDPDPPETASWTEPTNAAEPAHHESWPGGDAEDTGTGEAETAPEPADVAPDLDFSAEIVAPTDAPTPPIVVPHADPVAAPPELDELLVETASSEERPAPAAATSPFARDLPRILAIANQKGGVGKTTTAVNLGACLADLGYRVLVIDLDPQGNASTGLGINIRALQASMYDVVINEFPLEDCVEATTVRNLFVAPASLDLAGAEIELVPAFSRELKLRRALEDVVDDYDFVLIDCPPSLGLLTVNGLAAAGEVLVPIQCEYYALEGLGQLLRNVNLVQKNLNSRLELSAIVLVMYDARTKLADQVVREVRSHFGDKVCRNIIPRTVRLSEAPSFGQPIIAFDSSSRGAIAYRELAKEVSGGTPQRAR